MKYYKRSSNRDAAYGRGSREDCECRFEKTAAPGASKSVKTSSLTRICHLYPDVNT